MTFKINKPTYSQDELFSVINSTLVAINFLSLARQNVDELEIPEGIKKIGPNVKLPSFIKKINLGNTLEEVPSSLFLGSTGLVEIDAYNSQLGSMDAINVKSLTKIIFSKATKAIHGGRLAGNFKLNYVWIPSTVINIHKNAFNTCIRLKTIGTDNAAELKKVMEATFTPLALSKFNIVEESPNE